VEQYRFICPECGKPSGKVLEGKELHIHKIIFSETVELAHEKISQ
jgi:Zn finger protein HypA/HybF involved in hydrogenase expression